MIVDEELKFDADWGQYLYVLSAGLKIGIDVELFQRYPTLVVESEDHLGRARQGWARLGSWTTS